MVTGRVLDQDGAPVEEVIVMVEGFRSLGTLTDEYGRFWIRDIPPGSRAVRTLFIGHETDAVFLQLQEGDSVDVVLRIQETRIPIDGATRPLPRQPQLMDATRLLPQLLSDSVVTGLIGAVWPELTGADTLPVLASWKTDGDTLVLGRGPVLKVTRDCRECVELLTQTLEGGSAYVAGARHLNIGLRAGGIGTPRVNFCIVLVEEGDLLLRNCGSEGPERTTEVLYMRRAEGDWVSFPRW